MIMKGEMGTRIRISAAIVLVVGLLATGTVAYHVLEGWSYVDALYFTTTTVTTIGYGDLHPSNDATKLFTVAFAFGGISVFLFFVTIISEYYLRHKFADLEKNMGERAKKVNSIRSKISKYSKYVKPRY